MAPFGRSRGRLAKVEPSRARHRSEARRRDFKRRKRRIVDCREGRGRKVAGSGARVATRTAARRSTQLQSVFILIQLGLVAASRLASANEMIATELASSDAPLEAQPLVYNLLVREFGSGDGAFGAASRAGAGQRSELSSSSSSSSSVSPSLIEARCWNNYENDNNCKQLNVITAPNAEELLRRKQQQQQQQQQQSEQLGADNIITPVVIFEAASTIEPEREADQRPGLFSGQPPYQTSGQQRQPPRRPNDQFAEPPQSATILPVHFERPVTRPSAKNSVIYVATPQPDGGRPGSKSAAATTTAGDRKCRDEDDADCDEPDDESRDQNSIGPPDGRDASRPDWRDKSIGGSSSSSTGGSVESGSGGFAPTDDNEDSTDDDEADDEDSNADSNSIEESSGSLPPQPDESTQPLFEVTSVIDSSSAGSVGGADDEQVPIASTSTEAPSSTRQETGAEIEVVVHSTLPPSFPSSTRPGQEPHATSASTTPEPTTLPPDDVFTSHPIFPPSTEAPAAPSFADNAAGERDDESGAASSGREQPSTTELDLYTFKPIPIPVEQTPARYGQRQYAYEQAKATSGAGEHHEVNSQNIFKRPPTYEGARNTFDDGWTTRRPVNQPAREQASQLQPGDPFAGPHQKRLGSSKGHMGTDMLPTLLLYASIIVLVTTALIFAIMVYVFWRRNNIRRQNLIQKARLMNGPQAPHAAHLVQSMSHASQLHGAGPPSQGLLSTYAPGTGLSMGKVTTSLAKASNRARHFEDEEEEESAHNANESAERAFHKNTSKEHLMEGDDEGSIATANQAENSANNGQSVAPRLDHTSGHLNQQQSWSTDEPTTSSGAGNNSNSRTQDNQRAQQRQAQENVQSRASHYPNSLSDGRQNSSSISDSQCSPDASIERAPAMQQAGAPPLHNPVGAPQANSRQQSMQSPQLVRPAFRPQILMRPASNYPNMSNGAGSPMFRPAYGQPIMMAPNGFGSPLKARPVASRSIEDLQLSASSSHVGFVGQPPMTQQQVPYPLQGPLMGPPVMLPHLMRGSRPQNQPFGSPQHQAYPSPFAMQAGANQPTISPQRIAMNPLATLGRRYPPGAGLNRNIYSEDSSSFMTTSPSLARTSSSSSFAFNLAKHQPSETSSSVASFNSIKAKSIVDPTTGRVINDYTMQGQFDGHDSNGNGTTTGPPVFGRRDRSEAWYV